MGKRLSKTHQRDGQEIREEHRRRNHGQVLKPLRRRVKGARRKKTDRS